MSNLLIRHVSLPVHQAHAWRIICLCAMFSPSQCLFSFHLLIDPAALGSLLCGLSRPLPSYSLRLPCAERLCTQGLPLAGSGSFPAGASFQLADPVAGYPEGAKLLNGDDRSYVLAPLMNIVEETYTPYFEFTQPSSSRGGPERSAVAVS
jgi:hypothetical protein